MKFDIDRKYLIDCFERIISVPSPVGYYAKLKPVIEELAAELSGLSSFDYGPMEEFCAYALSGCDGNSARRAAKYLINERTSKP